MAFVKLDCGVMRSSLWPNLPGRNVFLTALLMAVPLKLHDEAPQLHIRSLEPTGWTVPPGDYGFVNAASTAIVQQSGIELEQGLEALERLGEPEAESRSAAHGGRRLVRVDGGFIVLNFQVYREKDHSAAKRQREYRERQADLRAKKRAAKKQTGDAVNALRRPRAEDVTP
jgi:hypothetical protein